jgi:CubicO group peptidase (beta-lactamase class C family)
MSGTANPFNTPMFRNEFKKLLSEQTKQSGVVASIALFHNGQTITYGSPGTSPDSLFRIASVSKTFTAAAIMLLVQDGKLSLDDSAFQLLGYAPGKPVTGYDPTMPTQTVSVDPAPGLFDITVRDLLAMTSGLPGAVTVTSQTYPQATTAPAIYNQGSYAALAFAGQPPYSQPATAGQQLNYEVYQISEYMKDHPASTNPDPPPNQLGPANTGYSYQDINYTALGLIVAKLAEQDFGMSYIQFLQQEILSPMGISPPSTAPVPNDAMVGLGRTLKSLRYPTEVTYVAPVQDQNEPSVFPVPGKTTAPFYPPNLVPAQYGGSYWVESHFGNGGLVATPTAVAQFYANLSGTYSGATTGPLTKQTIAEMVAEPSIGPDIPGGKGWFGLGMEVFPATGLGVSWAKNGGLPGNSAQVYRYGDGDVLAIEVNYDVNKSDAASSAGTASTSYFESVRQLVNNTVFGPAAIVASGGARQTATVKSTFAKPLAATVTNALGSPVVGANVTFSAPRPGKVSGLFAGGKSEVTVVTNSSGIAIAPSFTANGKAGSYTVTATVTNPGRGRLTADYKLQNQPPR